jgi:predicted enzyme related to lactoylglutathione lyase
MGKITGLGGVFIRATDPKALADWYQQKLGVNFNGQPFVVFPFSEEEGKPPAGYNIMSFFKSDSNYFSPSKKETMINLRVEDLFGLLEDLKKKGVEVVGETVDGEYGKFGWILDPEGNKLELWEPPQE